MTQLAENFMIKLCYVSRTAGKHARNGGGQVYIRHEN